jgi:hypothetical protein
MNRCVIQEKGSKVAKFYCAIFPPLTRSNSIAVLAIPNFLFTRSQNCYASQISPSRRIMFKAGRRVRIQPLTGISDGAPTFGKDCARSNFFKTFENRALGLKCILHPQGRNTKSQALMSAPFSLPSSRAQGPSLLCHPGERYRRLS